MVDIRTELVTALERVVLQSFSEESRPMTLSDIARANGSAVLTLEKMGYLGRNERRFDPAADGSFIERQLLARGESVAQLNPWFPLIPLAGWIATVAELVLGVWLLVGFRMRWLRFPVGWLDAPKRTEERRRVLEQVKLGTV